MQKFLVAIVLSLVTSLSYADINIGSWNIQRLGNGDQKSYPALAKVASKFDIFAVQEVMTDKSLDLLDKELEKATGEAWAYLSSDPQGRGSYKEKYAIFYKSAVIKYEDGAVSYLDRGDIFERNPLSARFKSLQTGETFVVATVHILYGKSEGDRTPEIRELANYWSWLHDVYPGTNSVFLMGDFNMNPSNAAWASLKQAARPLITQGASTLSNKDGKFANLYDNIWVSKSSPMAIKAAGVINYPQVIGWDHEKSRKHVSDHAPVFVTLGKSSGQPSAPLQATIKQAAPITLARSSDAPVKGNASSHIYHLPQCGSYSKLSAKNTVVFQSEQEAKSAGYRKAGNCN